MRTAALLLLICLLPALSLNGCAGVKALVTPSPDVTYNTLADAGVAYDIAMTHFGMLCNAGVFSADQKEKGRAIAQRYYDVYHAAVAAYAAYAASKTASNQADLTDYMATLNTVAGEFNTFMQPFVATGAGGAK